ncbi:hypothetical protein TK43_00425 [Roseovarius sp. JS7-11]|nr:hypothetical protein TK43_00425 [Roseovarius sp. JS7-11]
MSINDLVVRINSNHDFWEILRDHFSSIYVVFEFKNYRAQLGQDQIFSTERYLFKTAMRGVAIIISRKGFSENAAKAARGSLREHGKLIMDVCDDDLCEMLRLAEAGDDPVIVLSRKLDEMLVRIER